MADQRTSRRVVPIVPPPSGGRVNSSPLPGMKSRALPIELEDLDDGWGDTESPAIGTPAVSQPAPNSFAAGTMPRASASAAAAVQSAHAVEVEQLRTRLASAEQLLTSTQQLLAKAEERGTTAERQLASTQQLLADTQQQLAKAEKRSALAEQLLSNTRQQLTAAEEHGALAEQLLTEAEARVRDLEGEQLTTRRELEAARVAEQDLRQQLETARTQVADSTGDDLQAIRGIGPKLSKKLQGAGIHRYADLAALDPARVTDLAARLGVAPGRIERDGWIDAARRLAGGTSATD